MITEDRIVDVARAIERAHYPTSKEVTGSAFMGDAKSFVAALNAAESVVRGARDAPAEFAFSSDHLDGASPVGIEPAVPGKSILTFTEQPKPGDGFTIGKVRFEFVGAKKDTWPGVQIAAGADMAATVASVVTAINGSDAGVVAAATGPSEITVTAKDAGEPLLPVPTVAWSRIMSDVEKAQADRDAKLKNMAAAKAKATSKPTGADHAAAAPFVVNPAPATPAPSPPQGSPLFVAPSPAAVPQPVVNPPPLVPPIAPAPPLPPAA